MIRKLLLGTVFAAAMISPVYAADVVLCSGKKGGGYDLIMQGIGAELSNRGIDVEIRNLGGSEDILRALDRGDCSYGPAQADVHWLLSAQAVPSSFLYNEVITLVCSKSSKYDELSDLREGDQIIVDTIGSGSSMTWETLVKIENEYGNGSSWSKAIPVYTALDEAGASLSLPGGPKCAMGVGSVPINWAKDIESLGHTISWVEDKDINDLEVNGESLYPYVYVKRGAYNSKFESHMVPAVLFRSNKVPKNDEVDSLVKRMAPALGAKKNTVN